MFNLLYMIKIIKYILKKYDISTANQVVTITFETPIKGTAYIISKLIDKNFNIGNGNFIVAEDPINKGEYYISIDTKFIEILPDGNVTFKKDFQVTGTTTLSGDLIVDRNVQITGNTNIDGNLTIKGNRVDINTNTLKVNDNIVTLNMGTIGQPTKNAGLEVDRGTDGLLPILTFNEQSDFVTIPVKTGNTFTQDEIAGVTFTLSEINKELLRAVEIENQLDSKILTTSSDLVNEINRATAIEQELIFKLDNEISRSKNAEIDLQSQITDINDVMSTDSERLTAIQKLTTEFQLADSDLNGMLTTIGSELNNKIDAETIRLSNVESNLIYLIDSETSRVNGVTGELSTQINLVTAHLTSLENTTTENLNSEITRAINSETILSNSISTETTNRINNFNQLLQSISDLQANISINSTTLTDSFSSELSVLLTSLNNEINIQLGLDIEKGRIDLILSASTADKDSFKEIVDLINSIDVTNNTTFAGYVLSNDLRSSNIENSVAVNTSKIDGMGTLSDFNNTFNANKL